MAKAQAEELIILEPPEQSEAKRLPVAEQFERNIKIVEQRVRNVPWPRIAEEAGLSVRRCHQIFDTWREHNPTLREHDPMAIVDKLLYGYEAMIEDYQHDAEKAKAGTTESIGAKNGKLRAYREMAELLQAVGVLPNDLGTLNLHIDGQITADRIITVLERFKVPEEVFDAMLEALGGPVKELESGAPVEEEDEVADTPASR